MFILRFDVESAHALNPSIESDENWQIHYHQKSHYNISPFFAVRCYPL